MDLAHARNLKKGDYVMSAHTSPPFKPLRITEVGETAARFAYVRIHGIAGISQMGGGWTDATAYILPPPQAVYNQHKCYWEDKALERVDCRALWAVETARLAKLEGEGE